MTDTAEATRAEEKPVLPWQLRAAFLAEVLFLPVGLLSLAALPFDDVRAWVLVGTQVAIAAAAAYGLARRSRIAWVAAMVLAVLVIGRMLVAAPGLSRDIVVGRTDGLVAVVIVGWALLTQTAVLAFCVTLFWHQRWRRLLR